MKGDQLYAWQEQEPDGSWGLIAAVIPGIPGIGVLVCRDSVASARMKPIAVAHGKASGCPIRQARFDLAELGGSR